MAGVQKPKPKSKTALDAIDHVAISVDDIETAVRWYTQMFACDVLYQDDTWAYLKFANILLALVVPQQHRSHIALAIDDVEKHGPMKTHRDGTKSVRSLYSLIILMRARYSACPGRFGSG